MSAASPLSYEKHKTSGRDLHLYTMIRHKHPSHPYGALNAPLPLPHIHAKLTSVTPTPPSLLRPSWLSYTRVRDSQWGDWSLPSQSLWYQMDRGIGPDPILRKAAQQVRGALAGSPGEALLWFEGQASASTHTHTHALCACVCFECCQDAHGWIHNSWTFPVCQEL